MKKLLLTIGILFSLSIFASPINEMYDVINKANIISGNQQTGWKDVEILFYMSNTQIIIYSDEVQTYDFYVINKKEYTDYTRYTLYLENKHGSMGTAYIKLYKNVDKTVLDIMYEDVTLKYIIL